MENKNLLKRIALFVHTDHSTERNLCVNHDRRYSVVMEEANKMEQKVWGIHAHLINITDEQVGECCALYGSIRCENCPLDIIGQGASGFYPISMTSRGNFDKHYSAANINLTRLSVMKHIPEKAEALQKEIIANQRNGGKRVNPVIIK